MSISAPRKLIGVDATNAPTYLEKLDFNYWAEEFDCIFHVDFSEHIDNYLRALECGIERITVVFSDEAPSRQYGSVALSAVKKRILDTWRLDEEARKALERILDKIKNAAQLKDSLDVISGTIERGMARAAERSEGELPPVSPYRGIADWADEIFFSVPILGRYLHNERKIVLYVKNIEAKARKYSDPKKEHEAFLIEAEAYEEVFCHEFFHAFHYYVAQNKFRPPNVRCDIAERYDYTKKAVLESLASYYQREYCRFSWIPTDAEELWKQSIPALNPYAGARYIDDFDRFLEVFKRSVDDLDGALRALLIGTRDPRLQAEGAEQFYRIKNAEKVVVNTEKVFVPISAPSISSAPAGGSCDCKEQFRQYLLTRGKGGKPFSPNAVNEYIKYVKRAFEKYLDLGADELDCVNRSIKLFLINVALWRISKLDRSVLTERERKNCDDEAAALRKLAAFFEKEPFDDIAEDILRGHRYPIERIALEVVAELHSGQVLSVKQIKTETEMILGLTLGSLQVTDFTVDAIKKSTNKKDKALFEELPTGEYKAL